MIMLILIEFGLLMMDVRVLVYALAMKMSKYFNNWRKINRKRKIMILKRMKKMKKKKRRKYLILSKLNSKIIY